MSMIEKQLEKFMINSTSTIRQAMESINDNWREVTLVKTDDGRIIGTITDGDIRRGLLRGLTMESPATEVMNREFVFVSPEIGRAAVLDMMKALVIRQMPIIDSYGKLVGIHFLNDLLGTEIKPNIAVIMAGGRGTRLRPLTESCPKPMIQVAGRPILERVLLHLVSYGIRKVFISINYMADKIESHFGDGSRFACSIEYLREEKALGTGGALSLLPRDIEHPIVVVNGDQLTQADIGELLKFHEQEQVIATMGVRHYQVEIPFGVVKQEGRRLLALQEKPTDHYLVNTGIYVLDSEAVSMVPDNTDFPITALFDLLVDRKKPVGVYYIEEEWIDVGRHDDLLKANGIVLD
ncbi:MAG TPA: nucleotidyltransferase family protein [Syntrophorhabdales bacterium]|nr:nucleotidyltransferase family protein [Syntrophorhabdales bacterium]